jgi:hypothetical protein
MLKIYSLFRQYRPFNRAAPGLTSAPVESKHAVPCCATDYADCFILFLDFDGVLHPGNSGTFRHMPLLMDLMRVCPQLRIVVSSSWRSSHSLADLRSWFPVALHQKIVAVTPELVTDRANRQREIEHWLQQYHVRHFCALDDDPRLFEKEWPCLVLTDNAYGMTVKTVEEITGRYTSVMPFPVVTAP